MHDIENRADIETLINDFYSNLLNIEEIKVVFDGIDFPKHLPHIVHFWSFVLLDEPGYKTNVFEKHLHLPIKTHHFEMWLEVFIRSVNSLYKGERAEMAKQRATVLTHTFKNKWLHVKGA